MMSLPWRLVLLMAATTLAAGCPKGPPPDFFLLDPAAPSPLPGFEHGLSVGIGPVEIPAHLDRNQIVTRQSPVMLRLSERNVWAEPLEVGFSRALAINLAVALDSNRIYILPTRRPIPLDYRIGVEIARFDGELGGEVVLGARWTLFGPEADRVLLSKVSRIVEPTGGPDYSAFVGAQSRAIAQLGQEIAQAIEEAGPEGQPQRER
jgi:uncharacterized lipoprotein YmbA